MRLGVHVPVSKGLRRAAAEAVRLRCECMQMFLSNPRGWAAGAEHPGADVAALREARGKHDIRPLIGHASYVVNLASADRELWRKSLTSAAADMRRALGVGAEAFVVHAGYHGGGGERRGRTLLARALRELSRASGGRLAVLVENGSGAGTGVGWRFEDLAAVLAQAGNPPGVGVCLDTCHAHVAGYDLSGAEAVGAVLEALDRTVGLGRLGAVHLNDAKHPAGSRRDAHAHIGRGTIGRAGFRALLQHPRLADVAGIIETPKEGDADARNLRVLRRLRAHRAAR
ncbi:MAG: deoxyribonuclease IV [Armatimonadota bacterium]|nr:MAG: deoxyribonuclease IV [Armatimonadota bacterium]